MASVMVKAKQSGKNSGGGGGEGGKSFTFNFKQQKTLLGKKKTNNLHSSIVIEEPFEISCVFLRSKILLLLLYYILYFSS